MNNEVVAFVGRFQPFHYGHLQMIKSMIEENPGKLYKVILIHGSKSSLDTIRNPFSAEFITKTIKTTLEDVSVIISPNAYFPDIIDDHLKNGELLVRVYVGPDRVEKFKDQFDSLTTELKSIETRYVPKGILSYKYSGKELSGTIVRQMIDDGDLQDFLLCTEGYTESDFYEMKRILDIGRQNKIRNDINEKLTKLLSKIESAKTEKTRLKYLSEKEKLENQL